MTRFPFLISALSLLVFPAFSMPSGLARLELTGMVAEDIFESLTLPETMATNSATYSITEKNTDILSCTKGVFTLSTLPISYRCKLDIRATVGNGELLLSDQKLVYENVVRYLKIKDKSNAGLLKCNTELVNDSIHGDFDGTFSTCSLKM